MHKLIVGTPEALADALGAKLFELGAGGLEELPTELGLRRFALYGSASELASLEAGVQDWLRAHAPLGHAEVTFRVEETSDDWQTAWQENLGRVQLTSRLSIQPARLGPAAPDVIVYAPELCFGDGGHTTTRLAATAIERFCQTAPRTELLDVGSGNGVLCFVAVRSGAVKAIGIDTDEIAVAAAQHNAALNQLEHCTRFASTPLAELQETYPLVVANIDARTLDSLASELTARLRVGGSLLITGFLAEDRAALEARYRELGCSVCGAVEQDDWSLLELRLLGKPR